MSMISNFFLEGGFGMWPTLALGSAALVLAVRHALTPQARWLPLMIGLGLATLASGTLGCITGLISTFKYVQHVQLAERSAIAMLGVSESLTNLVLALLFCTLVPLLAGIGSWRQRLALAA